MTTHPTRLLAAVAATSLLTLGAAAGAAAAPSGVPGPPDAVPPTYPGPPGDRGPGYTLTVLHINDGESDLLPAEDGSGSISKFGTLLQERRAVAERGGNDGAVTITSGDNFLASPELQASFDKGVPFYDTIALDALEFDAFTIGNHEFDFGPDVLADFIGGFDDCASAPFLSANLGFEGEPALAALEAADCIQDSTIVVEDRRPIGIIGLTTPDLREVSSPGDVDIMKDLAAIANEEAAELTAMGVEIILVASHLQDIDNEVTLASELVGVDAIIGGGGGEALAAPLSATTADGQTIPIVTVPGDYFDLGELVIEFDAAGDVLDFSWSLLSVTGDILSDPFLLENVEQPVADFVASLDEVVLATSEVGLNGVRGEVRTRETNVGNLLSDSFVRVADTRAAEFGLSLDGPIVGLQNGGGIRNDSIIGPGDITLLDTFDIAPFTNFVAVIEDLAAADLVTAVEHGLSGLPDAAGSFAQWSGLTVIYDASAPAGSRVVDLVLDDGTVVVSGGSIVSSAPVDLATIDFLAAGNDGYDVFEAYDFTRLGTSYQQSLADQLGLSDLTADSVEYKPRDDVSARTRIIPVG